MARALLGRRRRSGRDAERSGHARPHHLGLGRLVRDAPEPRRHAGALSAGATVEVNNTTVAADGSPATLLADSFDVQVGWRYRPVPQECPILERDQRLVVRISAPADEITLNGSLVFEEIGHPAQ